MALGRLPVLQGQKKSRAKALLENPNLNPDLRDFWSNLCFQPLSRWALRVGGSSQDLDRFPDVPAIARVASGSRQQS
jgi:hypothetical protein